MGRNGRTPDGIDEHLARVSTPLTLISGYVQLLRRRLNREQPIEQEQLAHALETMYEAVHAVEAELRALRETARRDRDRS